MGDRTDDLTIVSRSRAEDLSLVALADVADALRTTGATDARVIGRHMVTLHARRHGLEPRLYTTTLDADLGLPPFVAREGGVIEALKAAGYRRSTGNRLVRPATEVRAGPRGPGLAVIDILVPAYTSRPRENVSVGNELTTIEVPGLALALTRPPVDARRRSRECRTFRSRAGAVSFRDLMDAARSLTR